MVGLSLRGEQPRDHGGTVMLTGTFRSLRDSIERKAQGAWLDPSHDAMIRAVRREFRSWWSGQQRG